VFVGFFMKEGVQETTKELSGSIATANRFYSIHDALNNIAESEFIIANSVRDINHVTAASGATEVFAKESSLVSLAPHTRRRAIWSDINFWWQRSCWILFRRSPSILSMRGASSQRL
jgi:hypothetical protein